MNLGHYSILESSTYDLITLSGVSSTKLFSVISLVAFCF